MVHSTDSVAAGSAAVAHLCLAEGGLQTAVHHLPQQSTWVPETGVREAHRIAADSAVVAFAPVACAPSRYAAFVEGASSGASPSSSAVASSSGALQTRAFQDERAWASASVVAQRLAPMLEGVAALQALIEDAGWVLWGVASVGV